MTQPRTFGVDFLAVTAHEFEIGSARLVEAPELSVQMAAAARRRPRRRDSRVQDSLGSNAPSITSSQTEIASSLRPSLPNASAWLHRAVVTIAFGEWAEAADDGRGHATTNWSCSGNSSQRQTFQDERTTQAPAVLQPVACPRRAISCSQTASCSWGRSS